MPEGGGGQPAAADEGEQAGRGSSLPGMGDMVQSMSDTMTQSMGGMVQSMGGGMPMTQIAGLGAKARGLGRRRK